jgi:hypothetical protein
MSEDFPATIKALRSYGLRLDSGQIVSFGDLVDALETPVRADAAAEEQEGAAKLTAPISADAEKPEPETKPITYERAAQKIDQLTEQLEAAEQGERERELEDKLAAMEARGERLQQHTEALAAARAADDVAMLRKLMGCESED